MSSFFRGSWYTQRESNPYLHLERVPTLPFSRWAHRCYLHGRQLTRGACGNLYTAYAYVPVLRFDGCCFSVARGVWVLYSQDFVCTFHCCCIGAACPAGVRLGASSKQRLTIGNLKLINHLVVSSRLSNCQILSVQLHHREGDYRSHIAPF